MPEFTEFPGSEDTMTVHVDADLSAFRADIGEATRLARGLGSALAGAFEAAIVKGRSLSQVLRDLTLRLARLALDAALKPLAAGISNVVGSAVQGILPFAAGGTVKNGLVQQFANGGVLDGPAMFPLRGGLGLAGEAGPEAILPLARGPDGRLGVAADRTARPVMVTFNIQTPDVDGFRRARGQIAADLSRAVERGYRNR